MARLTLTPNLTSGHSDELAQQIRATYEGQAYFANTGPFGATCHECCAKYHALTGKHGAVVPATAPACRYFERKEGGR